MCIYILININSTETHHICDQRHCFPLPEVWHAVYAVQSTTHPAGRTGSEQDSNKHFIQLHLQQELSEHVVNITNRLDKLKL